MTDQESTREADPARKAVRDLAKQLAEANGQNWKELPKEERKTYRKQAKSQLGDTSADVDYEE